MEMWYNIGNDIYVQQFELSLSRALSNVVNPSFLSYRGNGTELRSESKETDGTIPPHFYGELTKTDEGCELLKEKGHLENFIKTVKEFSEKNPQCSVATLKAHVWALGHIGSTPKGIKLLKKQ